MVVPPLLRLPQAIRPDPPHLRVFVRHPVRLPAAGRRQDDPDPVLLRTLKNIVQPAKLKVPFLRLQRRPRKNPCSHRVHVGGFQQNEILREDLRLPKPLLGIVIPAVKNRRLERSFQFSVFCFLPGFIPRDFCIEKRLSRPSLPKLWRASCSNVSMDRREADCA